MANIKYMSIPGRPDKVSHRKFVKIQ